jgi:hypothetical protein
MDDTRTNKSTWKSTRVLREEKHKVSSAAKRPFRRPRNRWKDDIKMSLKETCLGVELD